MSKPIVWIAKEPPQQRYQSVLHKNNICISTNAKEWDLYIPHYGTTMSKEMEAITEAEGKYVMGIAGCASFTRRKDVWVNIVKLYGREAACDIMPETFMLNYDADIDLMLKLYSQLPLILKSKFHKRNGLKIVDDALEAVKIKTDYEIAQQLKNDLYKISDTAFNLRSYILLTIENQVLKSYIYYDANCIYAIPNSTDVSLEKKFITNSLNPVLKGNPALMTDFCTQENIDYGNLLLKLGNKVNLILNASAYKLGKMENLFDSICFQVFGLDVLIDKNGDPIICEINKGPGMDAKNKSSETLKNQMLNDVLSIVGLRDDDNIGFVKTLELKLK